MKKKSKVWGNASLVTGILSLCLVLAPYLGLPLSIFSVIAAAQQDKIIPTPNTQAGRVCGIIGIVLNAIMLIFVIFIFSVASMF